MKSLHALLIAIASVYSFEIHAKDLCRVELVETLFGKEGPLLGCIEGDVVHFQIDNARVAAVSVAARFCNFDREVLLTYAPQSSLAHLVCKYRWKWAKDVKLQKHPDE